MSQPRIIGKFGKTSEPALPREGLLHPYVQMDGRHGNSLAFFAPRGGLRSVAETDKSLLLEVAVACAIVPAKDEDNKGMKYSQEAKLFLQTLEQSEMMTKTVKDAKADWLDIASLPENQVENMRNKLFMTTSLEAMHVLTHMDDFEHWVDRLVTGVELDLTLPPAARIVPIGSAALLKGRDDSGPRLLRPLDKIQIRENWLYLEMPKVGMTMTQLRVASKWFTVLVAALDNLLEKAKVKNIPNDSWNEFVVGSAAYLLGAYAGWNMNMNMDIEYVGSAYYDEVQRYLPLPWSDAIPGIRVDLETGSDGVCDTIRDFIVFNTVLAVCAKKLGGGLLVPMQYRSIKSNPYLVKQEVERALRPVLQTGGVEYPWMPMPTLNSISNGFYVPYAMLDFNASGLRSMKQQSRFNVWEAPQTLEGEKFSDIEVDRARAVLPEGPAEIGNMRLKISRDGFVDKIKLMNRPMLHMVVPLRRGDESYGILAEMAEMITGNTGFVRGDVSDTDIVNAYYMGPISAPKQAVNVSLIGDAVRYRTVYRQGATVLEKGSEARIPLPGEPVSNGSPKSTEVKQPIANSTMGQETGVGGAKAEQVTEVK